MKGTLFISNKQWVGFTQIFNKMSYLLVTGYAQGRNKLCWLSIEVSLELRCIMVVLYGAAIKPIEELERKQHRALKICTGVMETQQMSMKPMKFHLNCE